MRSPLAIAIAVILVFSGCSRTHDGSLSFRLSSDWNLERDVSNEGRDYYMLYKRQNHLIDSSLSIFRWDESTKPEEIPTFFRRYADGYFKLCQKGGSVVNGTDMQFENFDGAQGQGSYAAFQVDKNGGKVQLETMFMMSIDGRVWHGNFLGHRMDGRRDWQC